MRYINPRFTYLLTYLHNAIHTQKLKGTWIQRQTIIWIILSKRIEYPAIASTVSSEVSISVFDMTNDRKSTKHRHTTVKSICDVDWHNSNVFDVFIHYYWCNIFASCINTQIAFFLSYLGLMSFCTTYQIF